MIYNDWTLSYDARAMPGLTPIAPSDERLMSAWKCNQPIKFDELRKFANGIDGAVTRINTIGTSAIMAALATVGTQRAGFGSYYPDHVTENVMGLGAKVAAAFRNGGFLTGQDAPFIKLLTSCVSQQPAVTKSVATRSLLLGSE